MRIKRFVSLDEVSSPTLADGWHIPVCKQSVAHFFNTTQSRGKTSQIQVQNILDNYLFL